MPEAVVEKEVCGKCGADVRDGTAFCYSCGNSLAAPAATEPDLQQTLGMEPAIPKILEPSPEAVTSEPDPAPEKERDKDKEKEKDEKLTAAAEKRRKARVAQRKPVEYSWEPVDDYRPVLLVAILIALVAAAIVGSMIYWR